MERKRIKSLPLPELKAYQKAATLCSRTEYSAADIKQKLLRWGLSAEQVLSLIKKLVSEGFIDDRRFARSFVRDRLRFNAWGRSKIEWMLRRRGVPAEIIAEALEEIDEEIFLNRLREILSVRASRMKTRDAFSKKSSLIRFALSRGYSYEDTLHVLDELGL